MLIQGSSVSNGLEKGPAWRARNKSAVHLRPGGAAVRPGGTRAPSTTHRRAIAHRLADKVQARRDFALRQPAALP